VAAPLAVKVEETPEQIVSADAEMLTVKSGFTLIVMLAVPVHPDEVPVTE
jgi:hypothetical protein